MDAKKNKFIDDCRDETLRLNPGLDYKRKWEIYHKVKSVVNLPMLFKMVNQGEPFPKLEHLPARFCIKGDLGEQANEVLLISKIMGNSHFFDHMHKKKYDKRSLYLKAQQMLKKSKRLIFEEWLGDKHHIPADIKVEILRGEVFFIGVIDRNSGKNITNLFDGNWKRVAFNDIFVDKIPYIKLDMPDKQAYSLLPDEGTRKAVIETAFKVYETFGKPTLLRVDLYAIKGKVYFGECTLRCGLLKNCKLQPNALKKLLNL